MRKIPPALREEMANDKYYKKCCLADFQCAGRIEWHHNLMYGGSQVNEKWSILPLCHAHHSKADKTNVREKLDWIMLNRGTDEELRAKSKAKRYIEIRDRLNEKYG